MSEQLCLKCRHFVILWNKKNPLRYFRAMVILIMKIFDLFLSDNADWGYHVRYGHAFFLNILFIVKHYLN